MRVTETKWYSIIGGPSDRPCDDNATIEDVAIVETPSGLAHKCLKCGHEVEEVRKFGGDHFFIHGPFPIAARLVMKNDQS